MMLVPPEAAPLLPRPRLPQTHRPIEIGRRQHVPVAREDCIADVAAESLYVARFLPGPRIDKDEPVRDGRREQPAVWRKGTRPATGSGAEQLLARREVPQGDPGNTPEFRVDGDCLAVRRERIRQRGGR